LNCFGSCGACFAWASAVVFARMAAGVTNSKIFPDEDVVVLVEEVLHPLLVVEPALHLDHAARAVVLEEALLFFVGLVEERQGRAHAPRAVVVVHLERELVEAPVRVDAERLLLEHEQMLADRRLDVVRVLVELGQDLALEGLVGLEPRGHLEGLDRVRPLPLAVAVDETERVPERVLEIGIRDVRGRETAEHLAERPLEALPVLLTGEDLVDAVEGLEVLRV
jgi:hypothetical protein